jgi:tRNA(fMet)-specific endonuclease VapC
VLAELYAWAYKRDDPEPVLTALDSFLASEVRVVQFDEDCAETFGKLYGEMRRAGTLIQPVDLMIAAVAVCFDYTLVTNNTKDFRNVPQLQVVDWLTP